MADRYRKLPIEIEAMLFDGLNTEDVLDWLEPHFADSTAEDIGGTVIAPDVSELSYFTIHTSEGVMRADPGDWIIQEPFPTGDRQFYPVKPNIFAQTFGDAEFVQRFKGPQAGHPVRLTPRQANRFLRGTHLLILLKMQGNSVAKWRAQVLRFAGRTARRVIPFVGIKYSRQSVVEFLE